MGQLSLHITAWLLSKLLAVCPMEMVACGGTTTKNMYAESPPQPLKVLGMPLVEALRGLVRAERLPARAQLDGLVGDTVGLDVGLHVSPMPVGAEVGAGVAAQQSAPRIVNQA